MTMICLYGHILELSIDRGLINENESEPEPEPAKFKSGQGIIFMLKVHTMP